mmetsp:Transcript_72069/g.220612  ORF Transcript_72069/g.220612 Transcript_72069/m.220612 type:complete len:232 (+) Transcript_72069:2024-2719(+)
MPRLLESRRLIIGELPDGKQRGVAYSRVRMLSVLQQKLGHLVYVLLLLHELDYLPRRCQRRQLSLPPVLRGEVADEPEQVRAQQLHRHRPGDAVDGLLPCALELVHVLVALLVVHPVDPRLHLVVPIVDLQHELHASLDHDGGELLERLGEPFGPLFQVAHQPLQGEAPGAVHHALPRPGHAGHELRRLEGGHELALEELGLHRGDLGEGLHGLLEHVLVAGLGQLLEDLH